MDSRHDRLVLCGSPTIRAILFSWPNEILELKEENELTLV
jgi:hypothetical protein